MTADLILKDGLFTTLDRSNSSATAVAIANGAFSAVGREQDVMQHAGPSTRIIERGGHRALPSDRARQYNLECDGVFPRSVNQRLAQPHHGGSRHDRRPIDRGIPNRQIGLRQNFGGWPGPRQTADLWWKAAAD